jgi:plasmid stabilization system protein ParE
MVKIVWTEISIIDLKEIFDFIADDSVRYATITTNRIYQRAQEIIDNPYLGRIVPEFNEKFVRELVEGNYKIIYRIKSNIQIDILRVYHSSRLLKRKTIK